MVEECATSSTTYYYMLLVNWRSDKGIRKIRIKCDMFYSPCRVAIDQFGSSYEHSCGSLVFPSLRSIQVLGCGNMIKLPFDSNSASKLRPISGSQTWWSNLKWDDLTIKATLQSKFQAHKYYIYWAQLSLRGKGKGRYFREVGPTHLRSLPLGLGRLSPRGWPSWWCGPSGEVPRPQMAA